MAELNPASISGLLEWFKKSPFAKHYPDEIAGIENVYDILEEVKRECPTAADVCERIRNRYNRAFYNELREDHKKWVNENSPKNARKEEESQQGNEAPKP